MASELVRIKVTNQQMMDENDGLKMQVEQLQAIVDAQPGQVEATLRAEMDRIMARNIEVQNENRSLEESQAEMEKELVTTKMAFAEVCALSEAVCG
jgi:succinate dehydrogenase/fumarate reductase flavoprotein subunit